MSEKYVIYIISLVCFILSLYTCGFKLFSFNKGQWKKNTEIIKSEIYSECIFATFITYSIPFSILGTIGIIYSGICGESTFMGYADDFLLAYFSCSIIFLLILFSFTCLLDSIFDFESPDFTYEDKKWLDLTLDFYCGLNFSKLKRVFRKEKTKSQKGFKLVLQDKNKSIFIKCKITETIPDRYTWYINDVKIPQGEIDIFDFNCLFFDGVCKGLAKEFPDLHKKELIALKSIKKLIEENNFTKEEVETFYCENEEKYLVLQKIANLVVANKLQNKIYLVFMKG